MATLKGSPELRRRLEAIKKSWKPIARAWGKADVAEMRPRVPVRTGRLRKSFRVTSVSSKKVRVGGHYTAYFIDHGTKAHTITPKKKFLVFKSGGKTIFARKANHRGFRGRPFRKEAALEALRKNPMADELIRQWNEAA